MEKSTNQEQKEYTIVDTRLCCSYKKSFHILFPGANMGIDNTCAGSTYSTIKSIYSTQHICDICKGSRIRVGSYTPW